MLSKHRQRLLFPILISHCFLNKTDAKIIIRKTKDKSKKTKDKSKKIKVKANGTKAEWKLT